MPVVTFDRVLLFLMVLTWGGLHSLLAGDGLKQRLVRAARPGSLQVYRLTYNALALGSFLPVLLLAARIPDVPLYSLTPPFSLLLVALQLLAVGLLIAGFLQSRPLEFIGLLPAPADAALNTGGLYRYVRHPLYTAGLLFIWCMPVMTANVLAINCGLSLYLFFGTLLEERKLRRLFGEEYLQYMARTPMFLPRLRLPPR